MSALMDENVTLSLISPPLPLEREESREGEL
jgi:hypothetical protein